MILQWLITFIINSFNKQPEIKNQTTVEIIDSVIKHFNGLTINQSFNKFMVYKLPCKSYKDLKSIVAGFIVTMENLETPKTIKLQTIEYEEINYTSYFKKGLSAVYTRSEVKADIFNILNKLKFQLELLNEIKDESYSYYSSRSEIIIGHCVNILEILTHE